MDAFLNPSQEDIDQVYQAMCDRDEWLWRDPPGRSSVPEVSDLAMEMNRPAFW
jgi:hypothetical protein